MALDFETTKDITIPKDPFERIIGQPEAVAIAKMVPYQRRHLLLVGPPGTGKSMIAQAIASVLPKPKLEISVLDNPENPERPIIEIRDESQIKKDKRLDKQFGLEVTPLDVPSFVAERLGYRCRRCGALSPFTDLVCPQCGADKIQKGGLFDRYAPPQLNSPPMEGDRMRVATTRRNPDGKEEVLIYERNNEGKIIVLRQEEIKRMEELAKKSKRKVMVPLTRSTFVQASGGSETELLGDIRHDPYGGHHALGTPPYTRVVPGAVHDAHEGVLFIDELSTLGNLQRYILTAMQDKQFTIVGRNPMSSGAAVRVEGVPCDFLFVGACNINDIKHITPPLRSRIRGDGYEVLMNGYMEDSAENREKIIQFITQEIIKDGKIPHADRKAVMLILDEARDIARRVDNAKGLTLRLRNLTGIIKMAGDMAKTAKKELTERKDVELAIIEAKPIEEKVREKYGSWFAAESADYGIKNEKTGSETA
jgi:ATP-dependent Lon protease